MSAGSSPFPMAQDRQAEPGRIPELDALRGLAALGIMLYHSNPKRLPCGWATVDLFFVLSGFLITGIVLRHGDRPGFLRTFYLRRGLRIWPIYYLTLAVFVLASPLLPMPVRLAALPYDLTYTQNVTLYWSNAGTDFCRYLGHTWTLAIEEQFYLFWPVLILLVGRRGVIPLVAVVVLLAVVERSRGLHSQVLLARGDGLALGALLALWHTVRVTPRGRLIRTGVMTAVLVGGLATLVALGLTVGLNLPQGPPPWQGLTLLAFNAAWLGLIGLVVEWRGSPRLRPLRSRFLTWCGTISYGLYLYHLPVFVLSGQIARGFGLRGQPFWREGPTWLLAFGLAALSYRWVERPLLMRKDRLSYGGGKPEHGPRGPHARRPESPVREPHESIGFADQM